MQRPLDSRRERPKLHPMATEERSASPLDGPREVDMKTLHCGDLMKGCDFVATGATEEEVMKKTAEHAKSAHGMHHLAPETALTLRAAIHEEQPTG
jgi:predicted small metal-binding protein